MMTASTKPYIMKGQANNEVGRRRANVPARDTSRSKLRMHHKSTTLPRFDSSYGTYLASREWALKKAAVAERSGGQCENCHRRPANQVHHVSYERLYRERLDDLLHVCRLCHEYFSGLVHVNPRDVCCTPDEAREWADLVADDPALYELAVRHLREVEDAWSS